MLLASKVNAPRPRSAEGGPREEHGAGPAKNTGLAGAPAVEMRVKWSLNAVSPFQDFEGGGTALPARPSST